MTNSSPSAIPNAPAMDHRQPLRPHIRWMIRRDLPEILAIEAHCWQPWTEARWLEQLRQRNVIGVVAVFQEAILGFLVYEIGEKALHLSRLGVRPNDRRRRVATTLLTHLADRLENAHLRSRIAAWVPETELPIQMCLKVNGYLADRVRVFQGVNSIHFQYQLPKPPKSKIATAKA